MNPKKELLWSLRVDPKPLNPNPSTLSLGSQNSENAKPKPETQNPEPYTRIFKQKYSYWF